MPCRARNGQPLCCIPASIVNSCFHSERGIEAKCRPLTIALSFMAFLSPTLDFWHGTKCNIHTAAGRPPPAELPPLLNTHRLLSLCQPHPRACNSLPAIHSSSAYISSKLHWACAGSPFVQDRVNNAVCFVREKQWDTAPCHLHATLHASAVTSERHYLSKASVCFGLFWGW